MYREVMVIACGNSVLFQYQLRSYRGIALLRDKCY